VTVMLTRAHPVPVSIRPPSGSAVLRTLALAALVLLLATAADARKGGRHHGHAFSRHFVVPVVPPSESYARGDFERRRYDRGAESDVLVRRGGEQGDLLALVPADWREQPRDRGEEGRRFVSPAGDAWVEFYAQPADAESRARHLKSVAFINGEEVTYLQRERDWLAVSGFTNETGERVFYRKVVLACNEREWRHVAFEYPAEARRAFDRLVTRLSHALVGSVDTYCRNAEGRDETVGRR
jgi:hypothetical protein